MWLERFAKHTTVTASYILLCINYEHEKGAFVCFLRGELCGSSNEFFREISTAMRFPYYFGWNWNAFDECITDLE